MKHLKSIFVFCFMIVIFFIDNSILAQDLVNYETSFENITTEGGSIVSPSIDGWTLGSEFAPTAGIANSKAVASSVYGKDGSSWGVKLTAPANSDSAKLERPSLIRAFTNTPITSGVVSYQFDFKLVGARGIDVICGHSNVGSFVLMPDKIYENTRQGQVILATGLNLSNSWHTFRVDTVIDTTNSNNSFNYVYLDGNLLSSNLTRFATTPDRTIKEIKFVGTGGTFSKANVEAYFDNVKIMETDLKMKLDSAIVYKNDIVQNNKRINIESNRIDLTYKSHLSSNGLDLSTIDKSGIEIKNKTENSIIPENMFSVETIGNDNKKIRINFITDMLFEYGCEYSVMIREGKIKDANGQYLTESDNIFIFKVENPDIKFTTGLEKDGVTINKLSVGDKVKGLLTIKNNTADLTVDAHAILTFFNEDETEVYATEISPKLVANKDEEITVKTPEIVVPTGAKIAKLFIWKDPLDCEILFESKTITINN